MLIVLHAEPAAASTMRCDGGIVGLGDTVHAVRQRCGEPLHREVHQRRRTTERSGAPNLVHVTDIETWTYDRGYGKFILFLRFEGERLVRIDRGPRRE